jgi:hypothetical protein
VDLTVVDAIPVTTPVRTLLDLAAIPPADGVEEALDDALRRGLVTVRRLQWRLEELGRRPGVTTMRRLIETRSHLAETPESILETRFLRLLRRRGLPEPIAQYRIRDGGRLVAIVDFAYPERMLAVELSLALEPHPLARRPPAAQRAGPARLARDPRHGRRPRAPAGSDRRAHRASPYAAGSPR